MHKKYKIIVAATASIAVLVRKLVADVCDKLDNFELNVKMTPRMKERENAKITNTSLGPRDIFED